MRDIIGLELRKERKKRKLSQSESGLPLQLDAAVISRIENGKYTGSLATFENYCNLLGFELSIKTIEHSPPSFDELDELFGDE
ncbi:hypothetical protein C2869_22185 (plasmid) [Saccharobesus litoralis]|uniref:HTH cro/C1-type domain-containing protein n=1 Tax=Saccharobesus litoralis TaxID=2172099 RepID=A0A2S0VYE0_9ALTE|nr:helix-turn-helix transcriptional regulator [Saccharobesus litoralis]AWB69213.1 hypothetical protein C2869_22185 [Saccharobesus litoralis]